MVLLNSNNVVVTQFPEANSPLVCCPYSRRFVGEGHVDITSGAVIIEREHLAGRPYSAQWHRLRLSTRS